MTKRYQLIPALDTTDLGRAEALVDQLGDLGFVYGFKLGFALGLTAGLPEVVRRLRARTDKPLIYDHQKAGTDIPDTGRLFARTLAESGIDEAILFPQAGPRTLEAWVEAVREAEMRVIVGGIMTHPGYTAEEGGFLQADAGQRMYAQARALGVTRFVVPLTRPDATRAAFGGETSPEWTFYSPGYGKQGGDPGAVDFVHTHHVIVGRSLMVAEDPRGYVAEVARALTGGAP